MAGWGSTSGRPLALHHEGLGGSPHKALIGRVAAPLEPDDAHLLPKKTRIFVR
jgi:hypothetical protein